MKGVVVGDVVYSDAETREYLRGHEGLSPSLKAIGRDGLAPRIPVNDGGTKDEENAHFGLQLTLEEALWLMEHIDLHVVKIGCHGDGEITVDQFHEYCVRRRETFDSDYAVFMHFTDKGYLVKPGMLYGVDYTIYEGPPTEYHSKLAALVLKGDEYIQWSHIQCIMRIMTNVKKSLLVCHVDKHGNVCEVLVRAVLANQPHPLETDARRRRKTAAMRREVPEEAMEVLLDETTVEGGTEPSRKIEDHLGTGTNNSEALDNDLPNNRDDCTRMPRWRRTLCNCIIT